MARRLRRVALESLGRGVRTGAVERRQSLRLGSRYGGWSVIPELVRPDSIIYSFGIGHDLTWDVAMIENFGVTVHAFDPTPRSVRWLAELALPAGFVFHDVGLADFDGTATFVTPHADESWSSYSIVRPNADTADVFDQAICRVDRLATIALRLGHYEIDVLKLDIEGAEYSVVPNVLSTGPLPKQLLVEFHYFDEPPVRIEQTTKLIAQLNEFGYRTFARSPIGYEFCFVKAE